MNKPSTLRLCPDKAQYRPGETVRIDVKLAAEAGRARVVRFGWQVCELDRTVAQGTGELRPAPGGYAGEIRLPAFAAAGAYGVFAQVAEDAAANAGDLGHRDQASGAATDRDGWAGASGNEAASEGRAVADGTGRMLSAETAFDVAGRWSEAPRYGFLSDFSPDSGDGEEQADFLLRHHLNVVQFYDWMYRHDRLLTDEDPFTDPLGRTISLTAVRSRIDKLRERGIVSLAYAAVYASLPDYAREHPEQLLYRSDGTPYSLGNYFYIMDISPGSAWTERVTDDFRRAVEWGFDGLHLDQYGFPKRAIRRTPDGGAETVRLAELYPSLIRRAREKLPEAGLIFNNVGTYPARATAEAPQDAVYIEVWDPVTRLRDLYELVRRTRALTRKPIILAAYLPPFHPERPAEPAHAENGALAAMAAIYASGAYHLLLGENGGVLADPYYPKYGQASAAFRERLARWSDFIVMYRDLLFDSGLDDWTDAFTGGINNELKFRAADPGVRFSTGAEPGTVWTIAKEKRDAYVIHLVNLTGLDNDVWHAPKGCPPAPVRGIELSVEVVDRVANVFAASPDGESIRPLPLAWEWTARGEDGGRFVRFTLPRLDRWTIVCIRLEGGRAAPAE